jgi:dTDP-4-dehydrorhamnose 3,5-epimerase
MSPDLAGPARDIHGVLVVPLKQFRDERGAVRQMLKRTDSHFLEFGEIYFSTVTRGAIKAWKNHSRVTVSYACVFGLLRMVLYDERPDSPTRGLASEMLLGPDAYSLVVVPPGIWNGFQGLSEPEAVLASCPTEPVDPTEFARVAPQSDRIPFAWPQVE